MIPWHAFQRMPHISQMKKMLAAETAFGDLKIWVIRNKKDIPDEIIDKDPSIEKETEIIPKEFDGEKDESQLALVKDENMNKLIVCY